MWQGISLQDIEEEVALIKKLTPRGNFMSAKHTLRNYKTHWYPSIISRDTYDTWKEKGETIESLCRKKAQRILATHTPAALPNQTENEIETIIRRYIPGFKFTSEQV